MIVTIVITTMKRKRTTKKQNERVHAKRRALQRYGLNLTKTVRNQFKSKIQNNQGTFLYRRSRRISIWEIDYENNKYKVVYDTLRGEIVTFLPQEQTIGVQNG